MATKFVALVHAADCCMVSGACTCWPEPEFERHAVTVWPRLARSEPPTQEQDIECFLLTLPTRLNPRALQILRALNA